MKKFILKVDDLRFNEAVSKYVNLARLCEAHGVKSSIGVIGSIISGFRIGDRDYFLQACEEGKVELWNHSLTHPNMSKLSDMQIAWEIAGTNTEFKRHLGILPCGFGAPYNIIDERVSRIARQIGMPFVYEDYFEKWQIITPEFNVPMDGQPNLAEFKKRMDNRQEYDVMVIQVHPARWLKAGFEELARCLDFLREAGYESILVGELLEEKSGTAATENKAMGLHEYFATSLNAFWEKDKAKYDGGLSNFSSYFLARFRVNSSDINGLLRSLDADLEMRSIIDVGCGLMQWSLPFLDFNLNSTIHGFDTNRTICNALEDARNAGTLPSIVHVHNEDFTTSPAIPPDSVDCIVCANALNYIPVKAFARQCFQLLKNNKKVILSSQVGDFNRIGILDALRVGNLSMARERALSELQQQLVRMGFAGFLPQRTTYSVDELRAIFEIQQLMLTGDFVPGWERTYLGRPTFQGLIFTKNRAFGLKSIEPQYRLIYRSLLCSAGCAELGEAYFSDFPEDLNDEALARLRARSGLSGGAADNEQFLLDRQIAGWISEKNNREVVQAIAQAESTEFDYALAGFVAALLMNDLVAAGNFAAIIEQNHPDGDTARIVKCLVHIVHQQPEAALAAFEKN